MAEKYGKKAVIAILQNRDGMSREDATELLESCRDAVREGDDPEEILEIDLGLEPDYIWALI